MLAIAICDDEFAQREMTAALVRDYLKSRPDLTAKVSLFASGADLLDAAEETGGFGLYIMDIIMPKSSGLETAFKLRELGDGGAGLPMVRLSSEAVISAEYVVTANRLGMPAAAYMTVAFCCWACCFTAAFKADGIGPCCCLRRRRPCKPSTSFGTLNFI